MLSSTCLSLVSSGCVCTSAAAAVFTAAASCLCATTSLLDSVFSGLERVKKVKTQLYSGDMWILPEDTVDRWVYLEFCCMGTSSERRHRYKKSNLCCTDKRGMCLTVKPFVNTLKTHSVLPCRSCRLPVCLFCDWTMTAAKKRILETTIHTYLVFETSFWFT